MNIKQGTKILIVEDEPYLLRQIRDLLTQKGYIAETTM